MPLDLSGVLAVVQDIAQDDDIVVYPASEQTVLTKHLNEETGDLEDVSDPPPTWSGKGSVFPQNSSSGMFEPVEDETQPGTTRYPYKALLPIDLPDTVKTGMVLKVKKSLRDQRLVDIPFVIAEMPSVSTFSVVRIVYLKRRPRG